MRRESGGEGERMREFTRGALGGFVVLLAAIQFFRPARTNPPVIAAKTVEAAVGVPPQVEEILGRSCNDCHSNLTEWPWYTNVAPVSWLIAHHVNEGRRHLNFSEWLRPDVQDAAKYTHEKFESICKEVQIGDMPLESYTLIHRQARLSTGDVQTLCRWAGEGTVLRKSANWEVARTSAIWNRASQYR